MYAYIYKYSDMHIHKHIYMNSFDANLILNLSQILILPGIQDIKVYHVKLTHIPG